MKRYNLDLVAPFADPVWMRQIGPEIRTTVQDDGRGIYFGEPLRFRNEALAPGTEIVVGVYFRFIMCATAADVDAARREREEAEAAEKQRHRDRLNAKRAQSEALITTLHLPVRWETGIKDVLSGLSANSWGDGRSRVTVEHIRLLQPLQDGRLKRGAGDFLCTSASGTNGQQYIDPQPVQWHDGDGNAYMPAPSCAACMKIAKRFMKNSAKD